MKKLSQCQRLLFSSFIFSLASFSQAKNNENSEIEKTEVNGHRSNLIGEAVSASVGTVSFEDIAVRPLLRTGEILETVPGMVATQHSGSGKANQYFLRGFNLDHGTDFATSVDSMPVNMRTHGHGQGYTDTNFLIPELLQEINYKKGPYYADNGDFSGVGSANIITQSHRHHNTLSLGVGENGFLRGVLAGSTALANGDLLYGLEAQRYDGPWEDIDEDVDKQNIWLKQSWGEANDRFSLMLMAYDNSWNSPDQIPARAVNSGQIDDLGSIDTTVGGESSRYSLSASWDKAVGTGQLKASVYAIDYSLNLISNFTYFMDDPVNGDQFIQADDRNIYGWDVAYTVNDNWAGLKV